MSIARSSYLKNTTGGDFVDQKQGGTILGQSADTNTTKSLTLKDSSKQTADAGQRQSGKARKIISGGEFGRMRRNKFLVFGQADELAGVASQAISRLGRPSGRSNHAMNPEIYSLVEKPVTFITLDPENKWDAIYVLEFGKNFHDQNRVRATLHLPSHYKQDAQLPTLEWDLIIDWGDGIERRYVKPYGNLYTVGGNTTYFDDTHQGYKLVKVRGDNFQAIRTLQSSVSDENTPNPMDFNNPTVTYTKPVKCYKFNYDILDDSVDLFYMYIKTLPKFKSANITYARSYFSYSNINDPFISSLDVSQITDFRSMFGYNTAFNQPLSGWDVSNATNMRNMFDGAESFNQDISSWDVSNVTDITAMFANSNFNRDISSWNTSSLSIMANVFFDNTKFNHPIESLDTSNVTNMNSLFLGATSFNQPLNNLDMSSVTTMTNMLQRAESFNQPLTNWRLDQGLVSSPYRALFNGAASFNNDITGWILKNSCDQMFGYHYNQTGDKVMRFNHPSITTVNTSAVTSMRLMFEKCVDFNQNISTWDVGNTTNINGMFRDATSFDQSLNNWDTSSVTDMGGVFSGATSFNSDISNWNVSNVNTFSGMFASATSFNQDITSWDVGGSTTFNASSMFKNATSFDQDISGWNWRNAYYDFNMPILGFNIALNDVFAGDTNFSTQNYDLLLISLASHAGFAPLNTQPITLAGFGNCTYTAGGAAEAARNTLVNTYGWTLIDGGAA